MPRVHVETMKTIDAESGERGGRVLLPSRQHSTTRTTRSWKVDELTDPDTRDLEVRLRREFKDRAAAISAALRQGAADAAVQPW